MSQGYKNFNEFNFQAPQNSSTRRNGEYSSIPDSISKKFNWGAFLLTWIWGLGNKTYITLLIFPISFLLIIPFVGWFAYLGCQIWFGIKGNEWAWKNKSWYDEEDFHSVQKKWATAGLILSVLGTTISIIYLVTALMYVTMPHV